MNRSQKLSKVGKVFNDLEKNVKKSSTKQNEALNSTAKAASSLKEKLENAAKAFSSSSTIKNLKEIGASISAISTLFQTATGVIGAVTGEIMAMADAANTQSDAETKLALAAKNNPYLDDYSVQKLKEYAGELQGVSEVGDEVLLPMMAKSDSKKLRRKKLPKILSVILYLKNFLKI